MSACASDTAYLHSHSSRVTHRRNVCPKQVVAVALHIARREQHAQRLALRVAPPLGVSSIRCPALAHTCSAGAAVALPRCCLGASIIFISVAFHLLRARAARTLQWVDIAHSGLSQQMSGYYRFSAHRVLKSSRVPQRRRNRERLGAARTEGPLRITCIGVDKSRGQCYSGLVMGILPRVRALQARRALGEEGAVASLAFAQRGCYMVVCCGVGPAAGRCCAVLAELSGICNASRLCLVGSRLPRHG